MPGLFEIYDDNIRDWLPEMLRACLGTLKLSLFAFIVAAALGLIVALLRISSRRSPRWLAISFIEVMRGLPVVVILYIVYFVPPQLFRLDLAEFTSFTAAVVGLALQGGAILAEVFRSGIEALHEGQREAALALGMTPGKTMRYIILPQAMRVVLPPVGNYAIGLLKDTSVCAADRRARADADGQGARLRRAISRWRCSAWRRCFTSS